MIWNETIEAADRSKIEEIQLENLKKIVKYCYEKVPFYRNRFDSIGLKPEDIKTLKDVEKIPYTTKADLRDNYPYGFFAVERKDCVRLHASTGTTGKPTVVGYTRGDLENWSECIARLVTAAGGTADDIAQISFGYGLFTGGFGLHYGLEKVGATVIPISSGNSDRQLMIMEDLGSTILVSTPSYAMYLAEYAEKKGISKDRLKLRIGLFGGEGHSEELRAKIEEKWGILATENYGLSEVMGPGVSGECYVKNGMHINEDHFLTEIIDPDTEEVLEMGEQGELVITTLTKEAIPVLRYRTKDITYFMPEKCECGRTTKRMHKVLGRSDDMLIIRGVNVFPSQIESALMDMKEISPHYQIIVTKDGYMDKIEVQLELADTSLLESYSDLEALTKEIKHRLKSTLQIDSKISLVEPGTIERFTGKAKRVIDKR